MAAMTLASDTPRRRSRWPLFAMPILLLIASAAWSVFWFYAVSQAEVKADAPEEVRGEIAYMNGRAQEAAGNTAAAIGEKVHGITPAGFFAKAHCRVWPQKATADEARR